MKRRMCFKDLLYTVQYKCFYIFKLKIDNLGEHSLFDFSDCLKYNSLFIKKNSDLLSGDVIKGEESVHFHDLKKKKIKTKLIGKKKKSHNPI